MPQTNGPGANAPTPDVIVVGEALVDVISTSEGTVEHPGGSPANVAFGLARLGVRTSLLTSIGDDDRGGLIERHLGSAGVALLPGSKSPGRTASATATVGADGSASYEFDISWELPQEHPASFPKVLHTGSIASFMAPGAVAVKSLLERAHRECLVSYDPNIRPALLGSHAQALAVFEDLIPLTDVVKLSDEDARWLYPGLAFEDAAARILELGAGLAVITMGAAGSLLATRAAHVQIPSVKTVVADTIGAGDSYMAALIYGLLCRSSDGLAPTVLETLGRMASNAAAITVSRPGANPPTLEELTAELQPAA